MAASLNFQQQIGRALRIPNKEIKVITTDKKEVDLGLLISFLKLDIEVRKRRQKL